jgi:hypothetical protein
LLVPEAEERDQYTFIAKNSSLKEDLTEVMVEEEGM